MTLTTPNLELPYPELQDTADVPRDVEALAMKLDALLGGGSGGGGSATLPLSAAPVLDVGLAGQIRAGRQLSAADFAAIGLSPPIGLWSLSDLTNQGSDGRPLVNLGAVPFGVGINGLPSTAAQFAGSTGQGLYISDSGVGDAYRIRAGGTVGCWLRTAKRGVLQSAIAKDTKTGTGRGWIIFVHSNNTAQATIAPDGTTVAAAGGITDVCDDRWHFLTATIDGNQLNLYVDGLLENVATSIGPMVGAAAPLNIGGRSADGANVADLPFYGRVDEAFVTADVLTGDQVRLLYAARLAHTLGTIPSTARLKVHRRRRGPAFAVTDFPTQPIRLYNFTGGALTDQGSGGQALLGNPGTGTLTVVTGSDGTPLTSYYFAGAHAGLSATDAGMPGGLTARSYGCWFKSTAAAVQSIISWGNPGPLLRFSAAGAIDCWSGSDQITGPFVADGQWHFVVATEDAAAGDGLQRKLYFDGRVVAGSTVLNAITLGGAGRFRIAASSDGTSPFAGQIDGAFICGYALTTAQVIALYVRGTEDVGGSPKNAGDHVERLDAASVLFIGDTLEPQHTVDLGVVA